ncbi:S53 family peptidase [Phaeacidiphilus oryzae]|uniref:S53 family peptidase n=1 Tax=Phaeacidiphilus oryzae TaxID=348818 RepID=UPI0006909E52|nr:S53 family peptidase [Phaeacidiphilus oryzae]
MIGGVLAALVVAAGVVVGVRTAGGGAGAEASSDSAGSMALPGSQASWAPPIWATPANDLGAADPRTTVSGTVYFAKNSPADLAGLAARVGTPGDPDYHHYLSPAQLATRFRTRAHAAQAVTAWVRQNGMTIVSEDADSVVVRTTIGKVEEVLGIRIHRYRHSGHAYLSPTSRPAFPPDVGDYVAGVTGLTTSDPVSPPRAPALGGASTRTCSTYFGEKTLAGAPPSPRTGRPVPLAVCGYSPAQLRSAYGVEGSGLTGRGATVAVVDAFASPTIVEDVDRWSRAAGLPELTPGQFRQVLPASYATGSSAADAQGWWGEETLDVEAVHALAPDAKIVYYGVRSPDAADFVEVLHTVVATHGADIVSASWGGPEGATDPSVFGAESQIFEEGAVEGISFNAATGDDGDYTAKGAPTPEVSDPAANPWVTAVGGTSLAVGSDGSYGWESSWGDVGFPYANGSWDTQANGVRMGAGGGGVSQVYQQPFYQRGVVPAGLTTRARAVPDVAMDADGLTGLAVGQSTATVVARPAAAGDGVTFTAAVSGFAFQPVGGTSLATPLFSAMEALAQQAAGGTPLGFAAPALYAQTKSAAGTFHDVTTPPQGLTASPELIAGDRNGNPVLVELAHDDSLRAAAGYDDATGLGSPAGPFLTWFARHPNGR